MHADFEIVSVAPLPDKNKFIVKLYNSSYNSQTEGIVRLRFVDLEKNQTVTNKSLSNENIVKVSYPFKRMYEELYLADIEEMDKETLSNIKNDFDCLIIKRILNAYRKRNKIELKGKHMTGYTSKCSYTFLGSDKYAELEDSSLFAFLPCEHYVDLPNAYKCLFAFLREFPSTLPVFLYSILAFSESIIDNAFQCPYDNINDNPLIAISNRYYNLRYYSISFSLWLHGDKYKNTQSVANLFSNAFLVNSLNSISNSQQLHININTKTFDINDYKIFFKDIPIIVYSNRIIKNASGKKINEIIDERSNHHLEFSPIFVANNGCLNDNVLDLNVEKVSIPENLKSSVNSIYRQFVQFVELIIKNQSSSSTENFNKSISKLIFNDGHNDAHYFLDDTMKKVINFFTVKFKQKDIFNEKTKKKIHHHLRRGAYIYKLLCAAYVFNAFLITNNISDTSWLQEVKQSLAPLIFKHKIRRKHEDTSILNQDVRTLIENLKEIKDSHIDDIPQEIVWLDEYYPSPDNPCDVFSFESRVVNDIIKRKLNTKNSCKIKNVLISKGYMFRHPNEHKFVFDRNCNGKKYRVYKFDASRIE